MEYITLYMLFVISVGCHIFLISVLGCSKY